MLRPLLPDLETSELLEFVERGGSRSISTYVDAMRAAQEWKMASLATDFTSSLRKARLGELENFASPSLDELIRALEAIDREARLTTNYAGAADDCDKNLHEDLLANRAAPNESPRRAGRLWLAATLDWSAGGRGIGRRKSLRGKIPHLRHDPRNDDLGASCLDRR